MAIVVEEQRGGGAGSGGSIISFVTWLSILGAIAAAVYYLFFAQPGQVDEIISKNFVPTEEIAGLKEKLDPDVVVNDPRFKDLQKFYTPSETGEFGTKLNPFLPLDIPVAPTPPAPPAKH